MTDTEDPDFIEFTFADSDKAVEAEKAFPLNVVNLGVSLALRTDEVERLGDGIRAKLNAAGLTFTEAPSSLTEQDMWPEDWPDDEPEANEDDGGDDDYRPDSPDF
jgi:hypothetical protein